MRYVAPLCGNTLFPSGVIYTCQHWPMIGPTQAIGLIFQPILYFMFAAVLVRVRSDISEIGKQRFLVALTLSA